MAVSTLWALVHCIASKMRLGSQIERCYMTRWGDARHVPLAHKHHCCLVAWPIAAWPCAVHPLQRSTECLTSPVHSMHSAQSRQQQHAAAKVYCPQSLSHASRNQATASCNQGRVQDRRGSRTNLLWCALLTEQATFVGSPAGTLKCWTGATAAATAMEAAVLIGHAAAMACMGSTHWISGDKPVKSHSVCSICSHVAPGCISPRCCCCCCCHDGCRPD